jgi:hypothetical protein
MSPKTVFEPVTVARAVPVPLTTDVPRNTRCGALGRVDVLSQRPGNHARDEQDDDEGIGEEAGQLNDC